MLPRSGSNNPGVSTVESSKVDRYVESIISHLTEINPNVTAEELTETTRLTSQPLSLSQEQLQELYHWIFHELNVMISQQACPFDSLFDDRTNILQLASFLARHTP